MTTLATILKQEEEHRQCIPGQAYYRQHKQEFYWKNHVIYGDNFDLTIHLVGCRESYDEVNGETGSVALAPSQAGRPARIDEEGYLLIKEYVLEKPDATLAEIKEHYTNRKNTIIGVSVIGRALQKLDFRRKKKSSYAS